MSNKIRSNTTATIAGITAALSFVAAQAEAEVVIYTPTIPFSNTNFGSFDPDPNMADNTGTYAITFCGTASPPNYDLGIFASGDSIYDIASHNINSILDPGAIYI